MSSTGPKRATDTGLTTPSEPEPWDGSASSTASLVQPTSNKDELQLQELLLLREFFLLLDQWDGQQQGRERETT